MTDLESFLIRIEKDIKAVRPAKKSGKPAKALETDLILVSNAVCVLLTKFNEMSGELSKMKNTISSLSRELDEKNAEIAKMKENNVIREIGDDDDVSDLSNEKKIKSIFFWFDQ